MKQYRFHEHKRSQSRAPLAGLIFALVFSFLCGSPAGIGSGDAAAQKSASRDATLVCVISRDRNGSPEAPNGAHLDAVVLVENGKLRQPYKEYDGAAMDKFANEYFVAGMDYRVTFGGGEVGNATMKGVESGCNNIHATATLKDNGKIPAHLSALATNSASLGKKPVARRSPTDAERAAINLLVEQIYRSRGATRALLRTVVTTNLTATDLNGDGKFELIGSYTAETKTKARRDLLLIAEPAGTDFKPTLVNYQAYKLPPEGFDSAVDFVDQLDLDGDGIAEVFVAQHGFDAYGYSIYKKQGGRWRIVYSTTGDAC